MKLGRHGRLGNVPGLGLHAIAGRAVRMAQANVCVGQMVAVKIGLKRGPPELRLRLITGHQMTDATGRKNERRGDGIGLGSHGTTLSWPVK